MQNDPIYTGARDIPLRIVLLDGGEAHDPSDATLREITIITPSGTKIAKPAVVGVTEDGRPCLECTLSVSDLSVAGRYEAIGYIERAGAGGPAAPVAWHVYRSRR